MGNSNAEHKASQSIHAQQGALLRHGRAAEWERVTGDMSITRHGGRYEISFKPNAIMPHFAYAANPTFIDIDALAGALRKEGHAELKNVAYAGGTSPIVEGPDGSKYLVAVQRDNEAPHYPNTLDALAGRGNSPNILESLVGESVEEVLCIDGQGRVVVPQYLHEELGAYNAYVHDTIRSMSAKFALDRNAPVEYTSAGVSISELEEPFYLNGVPVGVGFFHHSEEWSAQATVVLLMLPPILLGTGIDTFKETLALETDKRAKERTVVLLRLDEGWDHAAPVIMYRDGKAVPYSSLPDYLSTKEGTNPHRPITPALATLLYHLRASFDLDRTGYLPPLSRLIYH